MTTIDINSDLAEGFGSYRCGDDDAMLAVITSANVACGFHAGDPEIMAQTFKVAKERGVAVGAHPGFPDLWGFGRRRIPFTTGEIERLIAYQIGAAQALAAYSGHRLTHVKTHGALGNIAETDRPVADAIARAVRAVDPALAFLTIARSQQEIAAAAAGLRTVAEIYADRGYATDGYLIPRGKEGAMIDDPRLAADRVIAMIEAGAVITAAGTRLRTPIESVCVHGDSPHAVGMAQAVRARLQAAGITIAPFMGAQGRQ
jgi:5-oxoprolinase (ATP-hydrolysing) subunit A